jgi:hypothetical protein
MKKKTFDAVEMKRRGSLAIHDALAHLTPEQQLAFWQERTCALREQQQSAAATHRQLPETLAGRER